ncbi:hypothetical protein EP1X_00400 [Thermococcus sp. EP1]|uniref:hypothetical protein n=1 Tax=Thermococcus sp. EP1 TaxID=1591054 RepID=UPI0006DB7219|nr:hypothetical protein [Thermococcus sp. EP1]KPU63702.1 hypothetical protein EP1X_00400 [Thermococcus sp. EP1]
MSVLDLLSAYGDKLSLLFLIIAFILEQTQITEMLKERFSRRVKHGEFQSLFKEYGEFALIYESLANEFRKRAGFQKSPYRSLSFWKPTIVSTILIGLMWWTTELKLIEISNIILLIWWFGAVFSIYLAFTQFSPVKIRNLGSFFEWNLGSLIATYLVATIGYFMREDFLTAMRLLSFPWAVFLFILAIWFPWFKERAMLEIWYRDSEFLPKKKGLLARLPYLEVTLRKGTQFYGKPRDIFDNRYLILRDGIKDIIIPWSEILIVKIVGGCRQK